MDSIEGNGIGLGTLLFIIFLILKLTGNISWSWFWVFFPLIAPFWMILVVIAIMFLFIKGE